MNPAHAIDERAEPAGARSTHGRTLPLGTRLRDYEITGLIGEGGFGIVYLAWDDSLHRKVAIKEYLPADLASRVAGGTAVAVDAERDRDVFKAGLKSFVSEARLLARFDHGSLVKVYRFWEENGTAYTVMPFYEGPTLQGALAELGHVPGEAELRTWLKPILNAVTLLHDAGVWHQNIAPEGIVLTPVGPVLLGLGAAEQAIAALRHVPATALKPGFAAIEQYGSAAETTRGAWTDLYALAAVVYTAITGSAPAPAADRLAEDHVRPLSVVAAGLYSERFLAAIDAALAVEPERRPRDHLQFRSLMGDIDAPEPVELAPPRDLMHEPFLGGQAGEREITVPDRPLMALGGGAAKSAPAAPAAAAAKPAAPAGTRTPARAGADSLPPRPAERAPSWMRYGAARHLFGKRTLYGLVAGTGALIGVAALGLQFYARQTPRPVAATPALAVPAAATPTPPRTTPLPATAVLPDPLGTAAAGAAPTTAATTRAVAGALVVAKGPVTASGPPASGAPAPAGAMTPPATALRPPVVTPTPALAAAPSPTVTPATAVSLPADDLRPPGSAAERQARCTEILQKASLERITAAETSFFKRECK
ncbi:MAG: serine/threonine-protein kinase [Caldimonas sp.]